MPTYVTTPIYYVNAQPHLGHAYTTIIADTYSRFRRLSGDSVRLQTGTDEHGEKIAEAAAKADSKPREYVDAIAALFQQTWPLLNVQPDYVIRTTDADHVETVQRILDQVHQQGDIYFSEYAGLYCRGCERFLTDKELVEGKCPDHLVEPEPITEQNYFFRMSKYQDWLIEHIKENPEFITPERYRNEVLAFLDEPLEDLCISRPTSRLTWGIPLPFDNRFVTYVWFDALINYLTGIGYPDGPLFTDYWPVAEHVIAKDILKPHAIYWPTMLKSMGLPPFKRLHVHGYWNVDSTKMSKSLGNVIRPRELVEKYGVDTVRYFLLREMSFGLDASFSYDAILARQNADLANDLGNLFSRSLTMIGKYADQHIPPLHPELLQESDHEVQEALQTMGTTYTAEMNAFRFHRALQAVWEVIGLLNRYIVTNAPWELAKDPEQHQRLQTVLALLGGSLWHIAVVLKPIMPETAAKMAQALGMEEALATAVLRPATPLAPLPASRGLGEVPQLFPRMEKKKQAVSKTAQPNQAHETKKADPEVQPTGLLSFAQFQALDLRVAQITAAQRVKKSERLLRLSVSAPEERTVVAGIAQNYSPEELIGKKVVLVANLQPAKLMGTVSEGMVLAAKEPLEDGSERLRLLFVDPAMSPGSKIS